MVIALASRSADCRGLELNGTSKPVGLRARRGSNPFPGAKLYKIRLNRSIEAKFDVEIEIATAIYNACTNFLFVDSLSYSQN